MKFIYRNEEVTLTHSCLFVKLRTLKRHLPHHLTDFGTGDRLTSVTLTRRNGS
jgi:hypothetical protein